MLLKDVDSENYGIYKREFLGLYNVSKMTRYFSSLDINQQESKLEELYQFNKMFHPRNFKGFYSNEIVRFDFGNSDEVYAVYVATERVNELYIYDTKYNKDCNKKKIKNPILTDEKNILRWQLAVQFMQCK